MAVASTGNAGELQGTGPMFVVPHELSRLTVLALLGGEIELFAKLRLGRLGKTDNNDYSPRHIDTSTSLLEGFFFENPLHDHTADMLRPS